MPIYHAAWSDDRASVLLNATSVDQAKGALRDLWPDDPARIVAVPDLAFVCEVDFDDEGNVVLDPQDHTHDAIAMLEEQAHPDEGECASECEYGEAGEVLRCELAKEHDGQHSSSHEDGAVTWR